MIKITSMVSSSKKFTIPTLHFGKIPFWSRDLLDVGHSQIKLSRVSSRIKLFSSSELTVDNVVSVELDGNGRAILIVGGSDEVSLS